MPSILQSYPKSQLKENILDQIFTVGFTSLCAKTRYWGRVMSCARVLPRPLCLFKRNMQFCPFPMQSIPLGRVEVGRGWGFPGGFDEDSGWVIIWKSSPLPWWNLPKQVYHAWYLGPVLGLTSQHSRGGISDAGFPTGDWRGRVTPARERVTPPNTGMDPPPFVQGKHDSWGCHSPLW